MLKDIQNISEIKKKSNNRIIHRCIIYLITFVKIWMKNIVE